MFLVKNTYGVSAVIDPKLSNFKLMGTMGGSSLGRKKYPKKEKDEVEVWKEKYKNMKAKYKESEVKNLVLQTKFDMLKEFKEKETEVLKERYEQQKQLGGTRKLIINTRMKRMVKYVVKMLRTVVDIVLTIPTLIEVR